MATEYGLRLRAARKHAGLTQEGLSKRTGIAQSTISTAERMGHGSAETTSYAKACGVDANWLATGDGEMVATMSDLAADAARLIDSIKDEKRKRQVYAMLVQMIEFGASFEKEAQPDQVASPSPTRVL